MNQSPSNSLQQELARLPLAGPHPDLEILAAFSEGSLLPREREEVFAHLAACADCRNLLNTAAAADARPASASNLYLMPRPSRPPLNTWLPWVSIAATVLIAASAYIYSNNKDQFRDRATASEKKSQPGSAPLPSSSAARKNPTDSPSGLSASQTALSAAQDSNPPAGRPHWRIDAAGHPQRSFADGAWQAVLADEKSKMRVISVFDSDVWIGGENSTLYHSPDNGSTWKPIVLPPRNGAAHTITHIRFQSAQSGKVESLDGTTWTTTDKGVTWH